MHFATAICYLAASATLAISQGPLPYVSFEYAPADSSMTEDCIWAEHFPNPNRPWEGSTCASFAESYFISEANFTAWNPIVGADCSNLTGNTSLASTYCIQTRGCHCGPDAQSPDIIQSSTTTECTLYERWPIYHNSTGRPNCSDLSDFSRASEADFIAWNPSVGSDCSDLNWFDTYCFEVNWELYGSPDWWFSAGTDDPWANYRESRVVTRPGVATGPIDNYTMEDCTYYMTWPIIIDAEAEDPFLDPEEEGTCRDVAEWYSISEEELYEWNPVLGGECGNLEYGNSYCVNVTVFPGSAAETAAEAEEEEAESESGANGLGRSVMLAMAMLLLAGCIV